MAFTIPFNEIVELTEIFFDSVWSAKLINTFQNIIEHIIQERKRIFPVRSFQKLDFFTLYYS